MGWNGRKDRSLKGAARRLNYSPAKRGLRGVCAGEPCRSGHGLFMVWSFLSQFYDVKRERD